MFWKKEEPKAHEELTVSEFIALDIRLNDLIRQWSLREVGSGLTPNTKLTEICIFNFKMILSPCSKGTEMREFVKRSVDIKDETDYTFSRIQDLYLYLTMSFPKYFLDSIRTKFVDTLVSMHYNVSEDVVNDYEYIWLLPKIQYCLRYEIPSMVAPKK